MKNATLMVVEGKLDPITSAPIGKTAIITAQYLTGQFEQFDAAKAVSGYSMRDILIATVHQMLPAEINEVELACSGLIEGTRKVDANGAKIPGKEGEGERTDAARKFASWLKSVYGAIRFSGMSEKDLPFYRSAEDIYAASREYRKLAGDINWKGVDAATREAKSATSAKAKAVKEVLDENGDDIATLLTMTPEQHAALQAEAAKKLAEKEAVAKLEALEKKAKKIAGELVKAHGLDDAESVLKRALEMIATGVAL